MARAHVTLTGSLSGDVHQSTIRSNTSTVIGFEFDVVCTAGVQSTNDRRCPVSHSPHHTSCIRSVLCTPVPQLKFTVN